MSNPNTITIFSPAGEPFEMSNINARDLTTHAGWTYAPSGDTPAAPAAEPETQTEDDADASATSTGSDEASDEAHSETEAGEAGDEAEDAADEAEVTGDDEPFHAVLETEADFAILTERQDVVEYLAHHFPAFKPHHKSSRDGLVTKALELQAAAGE